ncbi:MAG: hypothetical protein ACRD4D_10635 [Candidatus Acidiferrales bacterium]
MKNRWVAIFFSAVFPGLGQFVVGRRERGLAILAGWLALPALYGIIMLQVEQLAQAQGMPADQAIEFLGPRVIFIAQVDLTALAYAFLCLALYWVLNLFDAAQCAAEAQ